jgi:hypothetical protein
MPNVIVGITMSLDGFVTESMAMSNRSVAIHLSPLGNMQSDPATPRFSNTRPPRAVRW